jgi:hypothetical protein
MTEPVPFAGRDNTGLFLDRMAVWQTMCPTSDLKVTR